MTKCYIECSELSPYKSRRRSFVLCNAENGYIFEGVVNIYKKWDGNFAYPDSSTVYGGVDSEKLIYLEDSTGRRTKENIESQLAYKKREGIISYTEILEIFFATHNPTTRNQQGNDVGEQYRSIILFRIDS